MRQRDLPHPVRWSSALIFEFIGRTMWVLESDRCEEGKKYASVCVLDHSMGCAWDCVPDHSKFRCPCRRGAGGFPAGDPISRVGGDGAAVRGRCGDAAGLEVGVPGCVDFAVCAGGVCCRGPHAALRRLGHWGNSQHVVPAGLETAVFPFQAGFDDRMTFWTRFVSGSQSKGCRTRHGLFGQRWSSTRPWRSARNCFLEGRKSAASHPNRSHAWTPRRGVSAKPLACNQ